MNAALAHLGTCKSRRAYGLRAVWLKRNWARDELFHTADTVTSCIPAMIILLLIPYILPVAEKKMGALGHFFIGFAWDYFEKKRKTLLNSTITKTFR